MLDRPPRIHRTMDARASNLRTTILAERMGGAEPWLVYAEGLKSRPNAAPARAALRSGFPLPVGSCATRAVPSHMAVS